MTPELWRRASEIFADALERPKNEVDEYIETECAANPALLSEVRRLLADHAHAADFLENTLTLDANDLAGDVDEGPLLRVGDILAHRYRIVRFIQAGGMGEVYEAEDLEGHSRVALKTIHRKYTRDATLIARFRREVNAAKRVTHPNVSRIYDLHIHQPRPGQWPQEQLLFLTMELLDGHTLAQRLREHGAFPASEALPLIEDMVNALDAAHERNVIHRDFKAENVMLVRTGRDSRPYKAIVMDFGIARTADPFEAEPTLTKTGLIPGTPEYMAPEQAENGIATPASDVYALGVVAFEMVTGQKPKRISGAASPESVELLRRRAPKWEKAVLRCLAPSPSDRPSAAEFLEMLRDKAVPARAQWYAGRRLLISGLTLGIAALVAWYFFIIRPPKPKMRPSIALMGFRNASPSPAAREDLSPALEQGLNTALRFGGQLRVVAGENIAQLKRDLSLGNEPEFSPATLKRIRRHAEVAYVLCGSYIAGPEPDGSVTLSISFQDATSGETLAVLDQAGRKNDLATLAYAAGVKVRAKLRISNAVNLQVVRASVPSNPQSLRFYNDAVDALRQLQYPEAIRSLQQAIQADPEFALAHVGLADLYDQLDYDAKAKQESEKAYALSGGLSPDEQQEIEAKYYSISKSDWNKAEQIYRELFGKYPDNLEYGLALAAVQEGTDQLSTIAELRRLPPPLRDDPRIDMAEAQSDALSDFRRMQALAASAAAKAAKRGARGLQARALRSEAYALRILGDYAKALTADEDAKAIYISLGDQGGYARSMKEIAEVLYARGQLSEALEYGKEALAILGRLGAAEGQGRAMDLIGRILSDSGQLTAARSYYEGGLKIFQDVQSPAMVQTLEINLGETMLHQGDLAGARARSEAALNVFRQEANDYGIAVCLNDIASVLLEQGSVSAAWSHGQDALGLAKKVGNRRLSSLVQMTLGEIARERGDSAQTRAFFSEALRTINEIGDHRSSASAELQLAISELDEGNASTAAHLAGQAAIAAETFRADATFAKSIVASALLKQGKQREACDTAKAVVHLSEGVEDELLREPAIVRAASVYAACGKRAQAEAEFRAVIKRAAAQHWLRMELEARLGLARMYRDLHNRALADQLRAVAQEATAGGYVRLAREANSME